MSKGRALRFSSVDSMPPAMQAAYNRQMAKIPTPVSPQAAGATPPRSGRERKYGNEIVHVDGIRFDSKREARHYERLKLRVAAGEVSYFLRQVPIHLPGGTKLVVDFLEVHIDGSIHYVDAKGRETKEFRIKRREVQHHYPIHIELV